jgi:hypothetical protein
MGGGPSTTTSKTTTSLPTWAQPYAKGLLSQASGLYGAGSQYPQQQVAPLDPTQQQAFGDIQSVYNQLGPLAGQIGNIGGALGGLMPQYGDQYSQLGGVLGQYGQQGTQLGNLGSQLGGLQGQLSGYGQYAGNLAGSGVYPGLNQAQATNQAFMSGQFASPSTNPYLQDYYNAAAAPVIANYQQAVAPNILSNAIGAGGLGSSGTASAFDAAQANLGTSLQDLASNIYEPAYQQGMTQMQNAVGMEPGLATAMYTPLNEQLSIAGQQAQLANQQAGLVGQQTGLSGQEAAAIGQQTGLTGQQASLYGQQLAANQQQLAAMGQMGQAAQNILGIGGQQQQQQQNVLNALFQNQMMPYQMLQQAAGLIGPVTGQGGTTVSVSPNQQATK